MKKAVKFLALCLVLALAMSMVVACSKDDKKEETKKEDTKNDTKNEDTKTETKENKTIDISGVKLLNEGVLTVGSEVGYPPFEDFAEDGKTPIGYDMDIISEVADRLGLKVNVINTAWDGIFAGIGENYDVVCSAVTITADRKETMDFSTPYIDNYQAVVLRKDDTRKIESLKDLDGMVISLQKETTSEVLMQDYKGTGTISVEIVANEKVTTCFTQLENKEVDAVVVDSTVADGIVPKNTDKYVIAYVDKSEPEQFGIAMKKGNTELQKAINEALAQMAEEGVIEDTYDYWFKSAE